MKNVSFSDELFVLFVFNIATKKTKTSWNTRRMDGQLDSFQSQKDIKIFTIDV